MQSSWKTYQEDAARVFRTAGFSTEVARTIDGVRGKHEVDVWVTGAVHGIAFRWVIECKFWKTAVPKEKVMALSAIVQDIGADRGFLLSEAGFQAGAIQATRLSNITLTSVANLRETIVSSIYESRAAKIMYRKQRVHDRLWRLHKATGDYYSKYAAPMGQLAYFDLALRDAENNQFPTIYAPTPEGNLTALDREDLLSGLENILDSVERTADEFEAA